MKCIEKSETPPAYLEDWKRDFPRLEPRLRRGPRYEDLYRYDHIKQRLNSDLVSEQFYICCYCGMRIELGDNSFHIEHLKPRHTHLGLQLDYYNMLASCNGHDRKHCGHFKDKGRERHDENLMVSPLDTQCSEYFIVTTQRASLPLRIPAV